MNKLIVLCLIGFSVIYAKNRPMVEKPTVVLTEIVSHHTCVDKVINQVLNNNSKWYLKDIKITSYGYGNNWGTEVKIIIVFIFER